MLFTSYCTILIVFLRKKNIFFIGLLAHNIIGEENKNGSEIMRTSELKPTSTIMMIVNKNHLSDRLEPIKSTVKMYKYILCDKIKHIGKDSILDFFIFRRNIISRFYFTSFHVNIKEFFIIDYSLERLKWLLGWLINLIFDIDLITLL